MGASDHLNPQQFPMPGEVRDINGQSHIFRGWHLTNVAKFSPSPQHQHNYDLLDVGKGGVYVSKDPAPWQDILGRRDNASEVWMPHPTARFGGVRHSTYANMSFDEDALPANRVHIGRTVPAAAVEQHTATFEHNNGRLHSLLLGPNVQRVSDRGAPLKVRVKK